MFSLKQMFYITCHSERYLQSREREESFTPMIKKSINLIISKGIIVVLLSFLLPIILSFSIPEQNTLFENQSSNPESSQNILEETQLSSGQKNIVLRARQVFELRWTPLKNINMLDNRGVYTAGQVVQGLPYGFPREENYVPINMSFDEFLRETRNINSRLYTTQTLRIQDVRGELSGLQELYPDLDYNGMINLILSLDSSSEFSIYVSKSPFFSLDCSAFVSWAWGLEKRIMTSSLSTVAKDMGNNIQDLQVGDALNRAGDHVILITDVKRNANGVVTSVEIIEQFFRGTLRRTYGDDSEFTFSDFNRKYIDRGFVILRYINRDDVIYVHDCVVPIGNDFCRNCFSTPTIYMLARVLGVNPSSEFMFTIERHFILLSR
ncbi:MAG: hypothetical protein LBC71_08970 [Oscillospiraceae bacterium]|jgi:hypothetical protein|nr:hypothetical protein [Oscillospiraceae bacterium]